MSELEENITCSELLQAQAHIWNQNYSYIKSASLKCAVQLGIPDVIHSHGKPMTLAELGRALPINQAKAHFLPHLMRVLVSSGFFVQEKVHIDEGGEYDQDIKFGLTPASRLLLKEEPFGGRKFVLNSQNPKLLKSWQFLGDWFLNNDPTPFYTAHGTSIFKYGERDLGFQSSLNEIMAEDSRIVSKVLIEECKGMFEGLTSLTDVGGGTGTLARAISETFPHLRCIVFDLPHIVANLKRTENLEFVGGDMFKEIPAANAILLKWIIHNWEDEDSVKILKKCKEAIPSKENGGKIIIIEMAMDDNIGDSHEEFEVHSFSNMKMVALCGAKERTKKQWAKLFSEAGFSHYNIRPLGLRSIIELYP